MDALGLVRVDGYIATEPIPMRLVSNRINYNSYAEVYFISNGIQYRLWFVDDTIIKLLSDCREHPKRGIGMQCSILVSFEKDLKEVSGYVLAYRKLSD